MNPVRVVQGLAAALATAALGAGAVHSYYFPACERISGLVYGQRHGEDLTIQHMRPPRTNGGAVLVMVSGGWDSAPDAFPEWIAGPFLQAGFQVFAVSHLPQPRATVDEIVHDVKRAVRFVRHHAGDFGIDPERIGVTGVSSGGHLSLMLAATGDDGDPGAADPIDRQPSRVQAAAVFCPVTDLLNLTGSTEDPGDGGPPVSFVDAFGPGARDMPTWRRIGRELSPIYHVDESLPPVFIRHGDADTLVVADQSIRFQLAAIEAGAPLVRVDVLPGRGHGWWSMPVDLIRFSGWFEQHLLEPGRDRAGQPRSFAQ